MKQTSTERVIEFGLLFTLIQAYADKECDGDFSQAVRYLVQDGLLS